MIEDRIVEIGIDPAGSLYVKPETETFPFVYRAGMQITWQADSGRLASPTPKEWSYLRWFERILAAVSGEYGARLRITEATHWSSVSDTLRAQIEASQVHLN